MKITSPLESALRSHIRGDVRFDDATRVLFSTDASNYQVYPRGVVLPRDAADMQCAVQLCAEHHVPITARGGGSGLAGQSIGPGVVIDSSKYMHQILDLDVATRTVRVQPGMVLALVNAALKQHGLQFGPDPASAERACIGGILGTNATGAHSIRYGMSSDNVRAMNVLLSSGETATLSATEAPAQLASTIRSIANAHRGAIATGYPRVWRRASGYNLDYICEQLALEAGEPDASALFAWNRARLGSNAEIHRAAVSKFNLAPLVAGSEGTLAIVTDATLHLVPRPRHTALAILTFASLDAAMRAVPALLSLLPSAIELLGDELLRNAHALPEYARLMPWADLKAEATLAIEFDGDAQADVQDGLLRLNALIAHEHLPCSVQPILDAQAQADVWTVRKMGLAILTSVRGDHKPIAVVEDVAVPVERLPEFVQEIRAIFRAHGTDGVFYAHASAGVLHVRPMVNLRTIEGLHTMHAIGHAALALCARMGAAMSGEHGDGYERTWQNAALFGPALTGAFEQVKDAFDPSGLLNPGRKVRPLPVEALDGMMKLSPYKTSAPIKTVFAYRDTGGIDKLSEECNGSGVCRKQEAGVMCPSYRATLEEAHSTRGRANLLREYMTRRAQTNPDPTAPSLDTHAVKDALSLCLSCKACASECASRVDMAKMKSDFMQVHHDTHGLPLRAFVLGRVALFGWLATRHPVLAAMANRLAPTGTFKRLLRLAQARTLPAFASQPFDAWWRRHKPAGHAKMVVLYVDSFARYNHPALAIDAVRLLENLGHEVIVPPAVCCGRPMVSNGQPRAAQGLARKNLAFLAPHARAGTPILGLEPSCISMLRDDYPDLVPGADADIVASMTTSVEAHVAPLMPNMPAVAAQKLLLHGHCHQKAGYGVAGTQAALRACGHVVEQAGGSCCGMAGSFGFEDEHHALSVRIGEMGVVGQVRKTPLGTGLVAAGTSCRQQIEDLAGRPVLHPVTLLARAMLKP